jgi:hypothetical protein
LIIKFSNFFIKKSFICNLKYVLAASIVTSPIFTPTKSFNGEDVGYAAFGGLVIGTIISWAGTYLYLNKRCEKKLTENDKNHQATLDEFNARIDKLKKKLAAKKEANDSQKNPNIDHAFGFSAI